MPSNEVVIKVSTLTKDSEKNVASLKKSFSSLLAPLKKLGGLAGIAGVGGILLLGRSFINTAVQAGSGTNALWRFQEASFQLKKTLGELLLKALGPVMEATSKFFTIIGKAAKAIDLFLWRNWSTIMDSIRAGLSGLDKITGGFGGALGEVATKLKDMGGISVFLLAIWTPLGKTFEDIGESFKKIGENIDPILRLIELSPLGPPMKVIGDAFKKIAENAPPTSIADFISTFISNLFKLKQVAAALDLIARALEKLNGLTSGGGSGGGPANASGGLGGIFDKVFGGKEDLQQRVDEYLVTLNEASDGFIALPQRLEEQTAPIWERIWEGLKTGFTNTKNFIGTVLDLLKIVFMAGWNRVKKWFIETGWPAFKTFWSNAWTGVKDFVVTLWEDMKTALGEIWGGIETVATDVFGRVQTFIEDVWSRVKGIVDSILRAVQRAKDALGDLSRGKIPGSAVGGPASGLTLVGERGPELVNLPGGSNVIPNHRIGGMIGARSGLTINVGINGPVYGFLDLESQVNEIVRNALLTGGYSGAL